MTALIPLPMHRVSAPVEPTVWAAQQREEITQALLRRASCAPVGRSRELRNRAYRLNMPVVRDLVRQQARTLAEEERLYVAALPILMRLVALYDVSDDVDFNTYAVRALELRLRRHRIRGRRP